MNRPSEVWSDEALKVRTADDRGESSDAAERYEALAKTAPTPRARRWVTLERGELAERQEDLSLALEIYAGLYAEDVRDEYGAKALRNTAGILDRQGDTLDALKARYSVVVRYPDEIAAEDALLEIERYFISRNAHEALISALERLYVPVAESMFADNILFMKAQHCDAVLADVDCALDTYRRIWTDHRDGSLADDALWEMTEIYRRYGMWDAVVQNLLVFANNTESSWFVGDYNSEYLNEAIFDLGMIYMLFYEDYDQAVEYFKRYADDFEFSLRADDALWFAAEARRMQGTDDLHFYQLRVLLKRYPETRYGEVARARLGISGGSDD